jgi:hypothetical protein
MAAVPLLIVLDMSVPALDGQDFMIECHGAFS